MANRFVKCPVNGMCLAARPRLHMAAQPRLGGRVRQWTRVSGNCACACWQRTAAAADRGYWNASGRAAAHAPARQDSCQCYFGGQAVQKGKRTGCAVGATREWGGPCSSGSGSRCEEGGGRLARQRVVQALAGRVIRPAARARVPRARASHSAAACGIGCMCVQMRGPRQVLPRG